MDDAATQALFVALLVVAAAALVAHSLVFNFVTDDAFISFVYSRNLAEHGQLVFNLGEQPVEGYTNFLWTVLLAGSHEGRPRCPSSCRACSAPASPSATLGVVRVAVAAAARRRATGRRGTRCRRCPRRRARLRLLGVGRARDAAVRLPRHARRRAGTSTRCSTSRPPRARTALGFALAALTRPEGTLLFALTVLHRALVDLSRAAASRSARAELRYRRRVLCCSSCRTSCGGAGTTAGGCRTRSTSSPRASAARGSYGALLPPARRRAVSPVGRAAPRLRRPCSSSGRAALRLLVVYARSSWPSSRSTWPRSAATSWACSASCMPVIPLVAVVAALSLRSTLGDARRRARRSAAAALALALPRLARRRASTKPRSSSTDRAITASIARLAASLHRRPRAIGNWFATLRAAPTTTPPSVAPARRSTTAGMRSLDCFGLSDEHIAHERAAARRRAPATRSTRPTSTSCRSTRRSSRRTTISLGNAPYVGGDAVVWTHARLSLRHRARPGLIERADLFVPVARRSQLRAPAGAR